MESLRLAAYNSFNDRRSYEWKLSLAIWTALAVLVAGLVQIDKAGGFPLHGKRYGWIATVLGICLVALHVYFNNCIARANAIDKDMALFYSKQMRAALGLSFPPKLDEMINALPKRPKHPHLNFGQWGHLAQITITFLLTIAAVALVWVRTTP